MTMQTFLRTVLAAAAAAAVAAPAMAEPVTIRCKAEPGQRRVYTRTLRTDSFVRSGIDSRRTVTEETVDRQELVIETKGSPASQRIVALDTPAGSRLIGYEENGKDRLASIPDTARLQPLPPILSTQWIDARGQDPDAPAKATDANQAMELIRLAMRSLPVQPVEVGQTWNGDCDFGPAKATITCKLAAQRQVGTIACAVIESAATVTLAGTAAERVKVEKMTAQTAWAIDGSGWVSYTASVVIAEKTADAEQRIERTYTENLAKSARVEAAQVERARADLAKVEKALDLAKAGKLDEAGAALNAFVQDNPQGAWTPAVRNLQDSIVRERLVTQPLTPERFRLMLRDLQATRDQVGGAGRNDQVDQVERAIRQIVNVNQKALLTDAADPDPIVRDLAAFGLAFLGTEQAATRLTSMVKDASGQVRGTALIGLVILARPIEAKSLADALRDTDFRAAGAAALLVNRTVKRGDPQAPALVPLVVEVLKSPAPWSRLNALSALANMAPVGDAATVRALVSTCKAEKEPRLLPAYLQAMQMITQVDSKDVKAYEDWLKDRPEAPPPTPAPGTLKPLLPVGPSLPSLPPAPAPAPTPAPAPPAKSTSTVTPKG